MGGAPFSAPPNTAGPASPRVTNFAQNLARDGSAIKGMGAQAMGGLFGPGGGGGGMQNAAAAMMMMGGGPSLGGSGYDIDRAVALTRQKIAAGKTTGDDLFAAHLAAVGEE